MAQEQVIIIGAGGHGSELHSYLRDLNAVGQDLCMRGFVDEQKPPGPWGGTEILGTLNDLRALLTRNSRSFFHYITAVGDNAVRRQLVQKVEGLKIDNLLPWTLRHPQALVGYGVTIGDGTCLAPGAIVTTRVRIGRHCIVNVKASISHDCVLGDFANLNPGVTVCGNVTLGEGCFIGTGATIINRVSIGAGTIIGGGAMVIHDIPPNVTAVGVPARVIKRHEI